MGVSGCGKSAIGQRLAHELGVAFIEGDDFHSPGNVAKMSAGVPLTDADRGDWLLALQAEIRRAREQQVGLVLSCSSLKRSYRDVLRAADPELRFAHLRGDRNLITARMQSRSGHYMPQSLLDSQLATLEPLQSDEAGLVLDIRKEPAELITEILHQPGGEAGQEKRVPTAVNNSTQT
jgi:carbohydrate kinase (thermoresistant glucokinase family)